MRRHSRSTTAALTLVVSAAWLTFSAQGTFKLLFNSIFYGPAMAGWPAVPTSLDAQQ
jgi:hypothetical protein